MVVWGINEIDTCNARLLRRLNNPLTTLIATINFFRLSVRHVAYNDAVWSVTAVY